MINCYYCSATCFPNELGQYVGWGELSHSEPDDNTGHAVDVFGYICPDCADKMLDSDTCTICGKYSENTVCDNCDQELPVMEPCPYCQEPLFCINCGTPITELTIECPHCRHFLNCAYCSNRIDPNHKRCATIECTACSHTGITYHRNPNTDQMESRHCGYCYSVEFAVTVELINAAINTGKFIEQSMIRKSNATMIYGHKWLGNTLIMNQYSKAANNFYEHTTYFGYMLYGKAIMGLDSRKY